MNPKPGDVITFTVYMRGKVARIRGRYAIVRQTGGREYQVRLEDVVEIVDPEPSEAEVVRRVRCPRCGSPRGGPCMDVRYGREPLPEIKHPHRARVDLYVTETGWTPEMRRSE